MSTDNSKEANAIHCKVEIKELKIHGIVTTYRERVWIEDENMDERGSFQSVTKRYPRPKILVDFKAIVGIKLRVGNSYSDGVNVFFAVSENEIRNQFRELDSFEIPKELVCVGSP